LVFNLTIEIITGTKGADLDITRKYGFSKKLISEAEIDFVPYDRVKFVEE